METKPDHYVDIRGFRDRWGLTQQALADMLHVRKATVVDWESGRTDRPSHERMLELTFAGLEAELQQMEARREAGKREREGKRTALAVG